MSLAVPIRFSNRLIAALILQIASSPIHAGEDDFFLKEMINEQKPEISNQLPDWLKTQPAVLSPVFEKILKQGNNAQPGMSPRDSLSQPVVDKPIQGKWIFVSMSMPPHELKAAAEEAAESKSLLVFRGVEKGSDTGTITKRLYEIVKDMKPVPGAVIDPTLFTRFNVQAVPSMIETNEAGETRSARGLPGFEWLSKQDVGDHGQRGATFEIAEPDMIEEMQRRMREFDWKKEKQHAIDNFWETQKESISLPASEKNSERQIDMSIVSTKDIFNSSGQLIIKKGQSINPQKLLPMRTVYVVFDATDQKQVDIAKKIGDEMLKKNKPVIYMFTKMNTVKGWDHYNKITNLMNAPIYKLNQIIVDRFHIQALPSVIEGNGDGVLLKEIDTRLTN
jgi:conjugal transfer pilus assembly protein TraW